MTMVCNNCLQEILAGESFWEDETEGTAYHEDCRQAALDRRNKAEEERDAAVARAEAAEAEAVDLHRQLAEMAAVMEEIEAERLALAARVAELESQLAAQQWRPVTEDWPPYNERVIIGHGGGYGGGWSAFARRVRTDNRDGDDWLMDDDTTLAFESAVVAMRRPLPPASQEPPQ